MGYRVSPVIYLESSANGPLRQSEILSTVLQRYINLETGELETVEHPYAIIASQDCDLDWDFKARFPTDEREQQIEKTIPNILFCELFTAEEIRSSKGRYTFNAINTKMWERIKVNKDERYHFFQKIEAKDDRLREGLPELTIDFKRYFTIPTPEVYQMLKDKLTFRRIYLASPYLEHFSSRFAYFQSRIALPEDYKSEPENK